MTEMNSESATVTLDESTKAVVFERRYGAAITSTGGPHARKRMLLEDAGRALDVLHAEREVAVAESRAAAEQTRTIAENAASRLCDLQDLAEGYLEMLEQVERQIGDQRACVRDSARVADLARKHYEGVSKPFRRKEIPLARTVESLIKRLQRQGIRVG